MRAEIEVELCWVSDSNIDSCTRGDVATLAALLLLVGTEQSGVMTLLDHNEGDAGLVVSLQLDAGLSDGRQLVLEHVHELALAHTVPVDDDPVRLVAAGALVEHDQVLLDHGAQLLDDLLSVLLDPHRGRVPTGMGILGAHHSSNTRLLVVSSWRMCHISTQEDDWLVEHLWSDGGQQDAVDTAQLDIDLETEVGECLGTGLVDILGLDTLSGHPQHGVSHPLDLGVDWSLARQDHHHQLQASEGGLEISEHGLHLVRTSGVLAETWLANDGHASIVGDLLQLLGEVPQGILPDSSAGSKASNGPLSDLHSSEELLASHVPDSLVGQSLLLGPATILQLGWGQHTASDLHQAVGDVESKLLDIGVIVEVRLPDQVVDLPLPVRS